MNESQHSSVIMLYIKIFKKYIFLKKLSAVRGLNVFSLVFCIQRSRSVVKVSFVSSERQSAK